MKDSRPVGTNVGLLSTLAALALCSGLATAQPESVILSGTVRDFHGTHPDFGLSSGVGSPVTGLLDYRASGGAPVFLGNGLELTQDALDGASNPIAPHLFAAGPEDTAVFRVEGGMEVVHTAVVDLYDPDAGGYDASTATPLNELDEVGAIPSLTAPTMSVAQVNSIKYGAVTAGKSSTIAAGQYYCDTFWVGNTHTLTVSGDVVIRADKSFEVRNSSQILVPAGSSLTIWIGGDFAVENTSSVGMDSWDHNRVKVYNFGTTDMTFENSSNFMGTVYAPDASVITQNGSNFYGAITAENVQLDNTSAIHIAGNYNYSQECFSGGDTQQAAGLASAGQITGALSFAQWFRDVPGVNAADSYQLVMEKQGQAFEFTVSDWDPINGELYGNEGDDANRNFTLDLQGLFLNSNCSDLYFEIETGMDCWLFIDDVMVIDLGGTAGDGLQRIELDRIGLASDTWHRVRLLIAARLDAPQDFTMRTSVPLTPPRTVNMQASSLYD